jgi:hypothetical protein
MERLSLDLSYFPEEEVALNVCGDAGAGRLYRDEEVKEWYEASSDVSSTVHCRRAN